MYLVIDVENADAVVTNEEPDEEALGLIDEGMVMLFRFEKGKFEYASIHATDESRPLVWSPVEER